MPLRFTPEIAYLLGMWLHAPYRKGVGVKGRECSNVFVDILLKNGLNPPDKLTIGKDYAFAYNPRLKNALSRLAASREHRFKYVNDFSASYFAGWFDCRGVVRPPTVILEHADKVDDMLLTRLNFVTTFSKGKIIISKSLPFLRFIRNYVRVREAEVSSIVKSVEQP